MTQQPNNEGSFYKVLPFLLVPLAILVGGSAVYDSQRVLIHTVIIELDKAQLWLFSLFSSEARSVLARISRHHPGNLTWDQVVAVTEYAGEWSRWLVAPFCIFLAFHARFLGVAGRYCRRLNLNALLRHNARIFPAIRPVVGRNILDEHPQRGPWRVAMSPIVWCAENGLLRRESDGQVVPISELLTEYGFALEECPYLNPGDEPNQPEYKLKLDEKRAAKLFEKQLGPRLRPVHELPPYLRGLVAAFMLFGHGQKDEAMEILDCMSTSFREAQPARPGWRIPGTSLSMGARAARDFEISIGHADQVLESFEKSKAMMKALGRHAVWQSTWMHALLAFAKRKGVLPTVQFIWLKAVDRNLFYVLNQVGGRTAWVEASGPWTHFMAEEDVGTALETPRVVEAVAALRETLEDEGWLFVGKSLASPEAPQEKKMRQYGRVKDTL